MMLLLTIISEIIVEVFLEKIQIEVHEKDVRVD